MAFDYILNSQFTLGLPSIKLECYQSYHLYPASFCMERYHMLRLIKLFLNYFYGKNYFGILFVRGCLGIIIRSYLSKRNRKWLSYLPSKLQWVREPSEKQNGWIVHHLYSRFNIVFDTYEIHNNSKKILGLNKCNCLRCLTGIVKSNKLIWYEYSIFLHNFV